MKKLIAFLLFSATALAQITPPAREATAAQATAGTAGNVYISPRRLASNDLVLGDTTFNGDDIFGVLGLNITASQTTNKNLTLASSGTTGNIVFKSGSTTQGTFLGGGGLLMATATGTAPALGVINAAGLQINGVDVSTSSDTYWTTTTGGITYASNVTTGGTAIMSGNASIGGNLTFNGTLTGSPIINGTLTAPRITLGTGGSDVASSLASRAPRQGWVFDGTGAASTSLAAPGTAMTLAFTLSPSDAGTDWGVVGAASVSLMVSRTTANKLAIYGGTSTVTSTSTTTTGKADHWAYVLSGGNGTWYKNGVVDGTAADANTYAAAVTLVGNTLNGRIAKGTIAAPYIWNYAKTASEIAQLAETGSPPAGDYNSAAATVTAGAFVIGKRYRILVPGATNFTLVGAANSNAGTEFVATGVGTGDGTTTALGLLLATDPLQPGRGTLAYASPGTSANVTLGTGVTWAVPASSTIPGTALTTPATLTITNTTNSTSPSLGALVVTGGIGVGGNVTAGGTLRAVISGTAGAAKEAVKAVNTDTAGSVYINLGEADSGATPAYIIRYGSTNATTPGLLEITNGVLDKDILLQTSGTGRLRVPGTGSHVFGTTNTVTLAAGNVTATGTITAGSANTTITDATGKVLSVALNTVSGASGGTGVANTGKSITLGGNLTTSGAFSTTITSTANTSVTLPTSGTVLSDAAVITGAQGGTGIANTGKTLTLGGNLTTSGAHVTTLTTSANTSVTLPTTGTLLSDAAVVTGAQGGTGAANTGKSITLGGNLTTSGAYSTTLTATGNTSITLPTTGTLLSTAAPVTVAQGGTGLTTLTANSVLVGAGTGNVTFIAPGTSGNVLTSNGTVWTSAAPVTPTFAEIYVNDGTTGQSIATGSTYVTLTGFTTDGVASNCTAAAASDKITVTVAGTYRVSWGMSVTSDTNNVIWNCAPFLGGVELGNIEANRKVGTGADVGDFGRNGLVTISSVPVDIDVRAKHNAVGSVVITPVQMNLNVTKIN